jgi:putative FmdB family regulatory protein
MPLYEYQCDDCGARLERIQKYSDPPPDRCPTCQGPLRKLFSSPAIQFKGSGWYITDYARKSESAADKADRKADGKDTDRKADRTDAAAPAASGEAGGTSGDKGDKADKADKKESSSSDSKPGTASKAATKG